MGKIKIHELAKKLGLTSKDLLEKAKELKIDAKSHLSTLEDDDAERLEKSFSKKQEAKPKEVKKEKNDTPVIIRREVIINDDEKINKKQEQTVKKDEKRSNVGFVERKQNSDYNIVYRNKPSKPMTVSELFRFKK